MTTLSNLNWLLLNRLRQTEPWVRAVFLNLFLPHGTLGQLYQYSAALLNAQPGLNITKIEKLMSTLTVSHDTPVENIWLGGLLTW